MGASPSLARPLPLEKREETPGRLIETQQSKWAFHIPPRSSELNGEYMINSSGKYIERASRNHSQPCIGFTTHSARLLIKAKAPCTAHACPQPPSCSLTSRVPERPPVSRKEPNGISQPKWHLQEPPIVRWNALAEIRTAGECLVKRHSAIIAIFHEPSYATRIGGGNWPMFNEISPAKHYQN